jgi:hypothetical protein
VVSLGGADTFKSTSDAATSANDPGEVVSSGSGGNWVETGAGPDKVSAGDGNDTVLTITAQTPSTAGLGGWSC